MREPTAVTVCESDPPVVRLSGEIDFLYAPQIIETARNLISSGHHALTMDCSGVEFMDSSGLSALIDAWKLASSAGGGVRLLSPPDQLVRILRITRLEDQFEITHALPSEFGQALCVADHWRVSRFVVSARPEAVADVRNRVAMLARTMPFTEEQIEDVKLTVGEATSNAIRHGSPAGAQSKVVVHCERLEDRLVVRISDEGYGFDLDAQRSTTVDELSEGGRGLLFMGLLMDSVSFNFDHGTTVRMDKLTRR